MEDFEWHEAKAKRNLEKHGVDFEDAIAIFDGPVLVVRSDRRREERWKAIGVVEGVALAVVYTVREGLKRIISARPAGRHERRAYHEAVRRRAPAGQNGLGADPERE